VIAEFHREPAGGFDAGIGQETDDDDLLDAVLLELLVEVSVGKAALGPVLLDDDVACSRDEIWVPFAAPVPFAKVWRLPEAIWVWLACFQRS
jgi:hypothetical protein